MTKNRNKSIRTINVDEQDYTWLVEDHEDGKLLKIWFEGIKFYEGVIYESTITPSIVRDTIEEITLFSEE